MSALVFLDTETTGLDPARHEVWEVAAIVRDDDGTRTEYVWQLPVDLGKADLIALNIGGFHDRRWPEWVTYDPETGAMKRQPFRDESERRPGGYTWDPREMDVWCAEFADLTWGAHLVGAVVSFDADRLERLLRFYGSCPGWHYHLVDVEALGVGYVIGRGRGIATCAPSTPQANKIRAETGIDLPDIGQFPGALEAVSTFSDPPWSSEDLSTALGVDRDQFPRHTALGDARWAEAMYDRITSLQPPR